MRTFGRSVQAYTWKEQALDRWTGDSHQARQEAEPAALRQMRQLSTWRRPRDCDCYWIYASDPQDLFSDKKKRKERRSRFSDRLGVPLWSGRYPGLEKMTAALTWPVCRHGLVVGDNVS